MGLALHNYHDTYQSFPSVGGFNATHGWGFMPLALSFIEQNPLATQVDFCRLPVTHAIHAPVRQAMISVMWCPSDTGPRLYTNRSMPIPGTGDGDTTSLYKGTVTNYVGSYGDGFNNIPTDIYGGDGAWGTSRAPEVARATPPARQPPPAHSQAWATAGAATIAASSTIAGNRLRSDSPMFSTAPATPS